MNQLMQHPIEPEVLENSVDRASFVLAQIDLLKKSVQTGFLALGAYLSEVKKFNYYVQVGFPDFKSFVESTFEFKERQSYFLMDINDKKVRLDLPDELLLKHNLSCLKLIVSQPDAKIVELLHGGPYRVTDLRKMLANPDEEKTSWKTVSFILTEQQRDVVYEALALAKKMSGFSEKNSLLEVIAADFISGARDHSEENTEE